MKWYRLAADQYAGAQFNLGLMYYNGNGVAQDYAEAMKWYRLAAEQGDADAQLNVAVMYGSGEGVAQDDAEAYTWCAVAAAGGHDDANSLLDFAAKNLTPEELSQAQQRATELFEKIESGKEQ